MQQISWKQILEAIKTYVLNKYVLTLIVFAIIFIFVGEQSLIKGIKRSRQIHETEQQIEDAEEAIDKAQRQLHALQQTDSLEKFAREHYLMHKDNEDIFLVDEK